MRRVSDERVLESKCTASRTGSQYLVPRNTPMAGDWIPVLASLPRSPKIASISRALGLPRQDAALGAVLRVWLWVGDASVDGRVDGAVVADVDDAASCPGLGAAMEAVGWLEKTSTGLTFPEWALYNTACAKARMRKTRRQEKWRDGPVDAHVDDRPSTEASTREEKRERTEEKREPPLRSGSPLPPVETTSTRAREEIPEALNGEVFASAWAEFLDHRRHSKTSMSPEARKRALAKLARMGPERALKALAHSIEQGYRGIFEPSENEHNGKHRPEAEVRRTWLSAK